MRYIPWNEEVAKATYEFYDKLAKDKNSKYVYYHKSKSGLWSSVAESLVEVYYGFEPHLSNVIDYGKDMNMNGVIVDVKTNLSPDFLFNSNNTYWAIKESNFDNKLTDVFLFVQLDNISKKIALVGYLDKEAVKNYCRVVKKGEVISYGNTADCDMFIVYINDINPIY